MTKKKKIIFACISGVLAIVLIITAIFLTSRTPEKSENPESSQPTLSDVAVDVPKVDKTPSISTPDKSNDKELSIDVDDGKSTIEDKVPAEKEEKPITEVKPNPPKEPDNNTGNTDENPPENNKYSCGVSGHKCINAENHAYIANLELTGCEYCGSKNCVSFYYVSPAGIPMCNPTLCPKYNSNNDPTKTCKDCGKPVGTGSNETCEKFIVDTTCSVCGANVKAHTCHSH